MAYCRASLNGMPGRDHVGEMHRKLVAEQKIPVLSPIITRHCFHAAAALTALDLDYNFLQVWTLGM